MKNLSARHHNFLLLLFFGIVGCWPFISLAQIPIQASGPLIITESNQMVSMRDGISISLDIYRPAQSGSYPTLYSSAPYPHADDSRPPDNEQTGSVAWFVSQGFNYVIASSRGTGLSEGQYEFLSRNEQQDHYEIIEWIAGQSWSDGKVLGVGSGYYATAQWQMAIQNPPSLSCIAPVNGIVQPYQDWAFNGGLANPAFLQDWYETEVRRNNAFPTSGTPRLVSYDMRLQMLAHPLYDEYWQIRSSLPSMEAINVPVFLADSWQESVALRSNLIARERLNSIHKMAIFSSEAPLMQDMVFLQQHLLPYYRWCLQDESAPDFNALPDLTYQNRTQNLWQTIASWPPEAASYTAMFLNRQSLDADAPATLDFEIQDNNISLSRISTQTTGRESLTFISGPLTTDLEITGPIMLELYISSSEADTAFQVSLSEEINLQQITSGLSLPSFLLNVIESANISNAAATSSIVVTTGSLKASMRTLVDANGQNNSGNNNANFQPQYDFTQSVALEASRATRLNIALQPTAYNFRAGSRIVLKISQAEDDSLAGLQREDSLLHSERYPSRIWLPVMSGQLTTAEPEEDLSDIPVDLQSELISNPASGIIFDPDFVGDLNDPAASETRGNTLGDAIDNPVIFIRPSVPEPLE